MEDSEFGNDDQGMTFPKAYYMCNIPYPAVKVYSSEVPSIICVC